ncbi:CatB-related O-acetyltransferase [Flavimaricola marinus]|uniref:Streptogramin A acetyltransferase n=1 Tax=Flavimaricola marinus TaxID=1819565 RepID=A0A238L9T9_9RHOB|nr:CatB-related O-acetyltransferase [Flavimaricola marinus]SMY06449.1 Streptogramin A acetyltransferase [Flavimaricola marinus]
MPRFPSPDTVNPVQLPDGTVIPGNVFLKPVIDHPRIQIGDYTYASDFDPPPPEGWAARIAPFMFPISQDRLIIGKFGQIAHGVRFITNSANHKMDGFSTFPFAIHQPERFMAYPGSLKRGRDTVVGHDVWIGMGATILPGATIGNGVIISAGSVVAGSVPDYAIIGGNRAEVLRMRFDDATIAELNEIAWWDWDIDAILDAEAAITGADIAALRAAAPA